MRELELIKKAIGKLLNRVYCFVTGEYVEVECEGDRITLTKTTPLDKDDTLANGTCFELYDGPCFIGASTVIEYCEER